jgi:hypothetical protein
MMNLKNSILPSLTLKYKINEKKEIGSKSKTYTLPFKERALFVYEDVTEVKVGNRFVCIR